MATEVSDADHRSRAMNVVAVLRAPVSRRTGAEFLYLLAGAPLAALGFGYAVVSLAVGACLAVTAAGIPLLALGLCGARGIGGLHRRLAARLLDEHIEPPAGPGSAPGFLGWVQGRLGDAAGWRAMAYLLLKPPVTLVGGYVVVLAWGWGLFAITYPLQWAFGANQDLFGGVLPETRVRVPVICAVGVLVLLLAPWAARAVIIPDRLLLRWLLGRRDLAERVRDLEESRAHAVDDAVATLRRIERDLHDGAQVRLIALTMQLTMVRDRVPEGEPRDLVTAAQATAHEAIQELRELVRGIHPPALDHGLGTALSTLAARSGVPVESHIDIRTRPTAAIESIAYFCAAELLANVAKHSGAGRAWLSVKGRRDGLLLRVRDDGSGGATPAPGSGLSGLIDRVRTVDGRLDIVSPPGGPTVVTVELPSHA
jgi:signal transduction histidine kinase